MCSSWRSRALRRLVRQENGALLFRSGDVLDGVAYPGGEHLDLTSEGFSWSPGTLVDIVLARPPATARSRRGSRKAVTTTRPLGRPTESGLRSSPTATAARRKST